MNPLVGFILLVVIVWGIPLVWLHMSDQVRDLQARLTFSEKMQAELNRAVIQARRDSRTREEFAMQDGRLAEFVEIRRVLEIRGFHEASQLLADLRRPTLEPRP